MFVQVNDSTILFSMAALWAPPTAQTVHEGCAMVNTRFDSVLARKLNTFLPLARDELKCLAEIQSMPLAVKRGSQLTHEGQTGHKAFVLQEGWACSYKVLPSGARQVISFPIAGDIVGLRSVLLRTADHSFSALTDAVVSPVEGAHIMKCVTEFPSSWSGALMGCLTGRGHGCGAPCQYRPAKRHRANRAFLHGVGGTTAPSRAGDGNRV